MSVTDELLANAEQYAKDFGKADLPMPPGKKVAVVACMDARLIPTRILGLEEGDAHVIRNAGGVITADEIRSLAISQRLLGTEEIILIHHTDCGMLTFTDDEFKASIEQDVGIQARVGGRGVLRPRRRRPPVARPREGQPVHPEEGQRARLRLRGRDGQASRGPVGHPEPSYVPSG
jgi:Carbonic anhydrase